MGPLSTADIEAGAYPRYQQYHRLAGLSAAAVASSGPAPTRDGAAGATAAAADSSKLRFFPLMRPHERVPNLTFEDGMACLSIEVFEASSETIAEYDHIRTGGPPIVLRQVGLRCVHCARSHRPPTLSPYSMTFPGSLASVADNVRVVADHHLVSCDMTPPETREACQRAAAKRQREARGVEDRTADIDNDRARASLIDYCVGVCQELGVSNKPQHKSGIEFSTPSSSVLEESGVGSSGPRATAHGRGGAPPPPLGYERMGPPGAMSAAAALDRMGYPPHAGGVPPHFPAGGRSGWGPGGMVVMPGDSIAPTPVQRRRDRPMEQILPPSGSGAPTPSSMGRYPTPYSSQRLPPGSEYSSAGSRGGHGDIPTPSQPNFDGREDEREGGMGIAYPTPQSAQQMGGSGADSSPPGYQQYDLPSNFPFYQERDRTWHCKFCANIPPHFRDPQSIWSSPVGGPPPGNFIDYHLSLCRAYQQGYPSPPTIFQSGPSSSLFGMPPYGGGPPHVQNPYGPLPGAWESHGGIHPQHLQYPPSGPPHHGGGVEPGYYGGPPPGVLGHSHMDSGPGGGGRYHGGQEDPTGFGEQRPGPPGVSDGGSDNGPSSQRGGGARSSPHPGAGSRGPSGGGGIRSDTSADSMNHAISYLVQFEQEYYSRDAEHAAIPRLVLDEDRLLLTDYFFFLMKQLRLCRFSEADRKTRGGKREKIKIGYGGLQCVHCSDLPMSRKFFWSNVDRLANSFAEIPGHVLKCRRCPQQSKDALLQLKHAHPEQMAKLPRGSQKVFFRRMWRRLHDEDPQNDDLEGAEGEVPGEGVSDHPARADATSPEKGDTPESKKGMDSSPSSASHTIISDDTTLVLQRSAQEAARALAGTPPAGVPPSPSSRILLAIPDDKEWLSDMDCYIRKQLEVFCANEDDVAAAQADRKYPISVGQVGIRCIHCSIAQGTDAVGHAIAYPFSISGIYESVREFHRLHLDSCENLPPSSRAKLANLKGASSLSSVLRKYYNLAAKALGLQDTKDGIRSGGESTAIGSQAAFTFTEPEDSSPEEGDDESKSPGQSNLGITTRGKQEKEEGDTAESTDSRVGKRSDPSASSPDGSGSRSKRAKKAGGTEC